MFGGPPPAGSRAPVTPATVDDDTRRLGAALPPEVYLGTSSWTFPGWAGLVYQDRASEATLARHGLTAYAAHPLLRTVGLDRTLYAPVSTEVMAGYARAVPSSFRFLVKAHEALTLARFPNHPRYGALRGQPSPHYLDPGYARDAVVEPFVDGLGPRGAVLLFQFAPQPAEVLAGPGPRSAARRFAERLYRFLRELPRGPRYAVEVRTAALVTDDFAAALRSVGAVPCLAVLPGLPALATLALATRAAEADALVVRWMMAAHHDYDSAVAAYHPFHALVDPDPRTRRAIVDLVRGAVARGVPATVIVNNKAEGSSPRSVAELARELVDGDPVPF
ncbi:MAG: DUF72 domain-containing protein [Myxococcales bacterium]|nr:DUF72 domain-containing protein [Myxococcales bacterium]